MHLAPRAAPGRQDRASHETADGSGRLRSSKRRGVVACTREDKRGGDCHAQACNEIERKEHHLQVEQRTVLPDVAEPEHGVFEQTLGRLSRRGRIRNGHEYERSQGNHEGAQVDGEDDPQPLEADQADERSGEDGGKNPRAALRH